MDPDEIPELTEAFFARAEAKIGGVPLKRRSGRAAQTLSNPAQEVDMSEHRVGDETADPAQLIDAKIAGLGDWRGATLARMRGLIREADPAVTETVKWRKPSNPSGVPVWEHAGILCTGETYQGYVKLTFARGAALPDPAGLFNASLEGGTRRAIDIREDEEVDAEAFEALVQAAVALNTSKTRR